MSAPLWNKHDLQYAASCGAQLRRVRLVALHERRKNKSRGRIFMCSTPDIRPGYGSSSVVEALS